MNINVNKTEESIDQDKSPKVTLSKKSISNSKKKRSKKKQANKSSRVKLKPLDLKNINNEKDRKYNEINKYEYIYSPRTTFIKEQTEEEKLYNDIGVSFDPVVIKIIKSFLVNRI